jgi:two-component system copper resistance phosphate regulon response regulator CusR
VSRSGREIPLTPREYTLLEALARNEGRVLSRETIQERVWNDDESYSNTIAVRIRQLRHKVDDGHAVRLIHTVYGQGYVLRAPESEEDRPAG